MRRLIGCGLVASGCLMLLALALAFTVIGLSGAVPMGVVALLGLLGFGAASRLTRERS